MAHYAKAAPGANEDNYLISKKQAWFAFAMTFALMLFHCPTSGALCRRSA